MAFFGDGAVNNGAFHEGLNMASIWKLPVLFVCENNQFATEVPFDYAAGNPSVAPRGAAYGMPGIEVDGNDVLGGARAPPARRSQRARAGGGPTLLECKTYRTRPHAEGMGDFTYRTREEVEEWKTRCPILRLKQQVLAEQVATEAELEAIDTGIAELTEEAHRFAEKSPWPDPYAASLDTFFQSNEHAKTSAKRAIVTRRRRAIVAERRTEGSRGLQPTVWPSYASRRAATFERVSHPGGSSVATRLIALLRRGPWTEVQGYHHVLALRG